MLSFMKWKKLIQQPKMFKKEWIPLFILFSKSMLKSISALHTISLINKTSKK